MHSDKEILYKEIQRLPKWTWIFFLLPAFLFWGIAYVQIILGKTVGNNPMSDTGVVIMALLFGILLPALLLYMKAGIVVTRQEIIISLLPIFRKKISLDAISDIKMVGIKPIQEFGGWGIRWNGKKSGLILSGDKGIEIHFKNANPFVISTKNAEQLFNTVKSNIKPQ
ncbi:MAG: hypothetical protein K0R67_1229 [Paenibacillus sp.]|nr:hypothetical protein [Paenibacillus sp.]